MLMKHGRVLCIMVTVLTMAALASMVSAEDTPTSEDNVATVNGSVITKVDFDREMERIERQVSGGGKNLDDSQRMKIKADVLENLIDAELLYQESQKAGIEVEDAAVDEHLEKIKKRFPSETEFSNALLEMNLSETDIRSDFRRGKAIEQLIDGHVTQKINVTDEDAKEYYDNNLDLFKQPEQVRASHILIKADSDATESENEQSSKEIEAIQQKLQEGADFAALAREFSQGPSGANGGDLGYFSRGQMIKPFEEAAFSLKPGEVSDIVKTRFGYHLIKVVDRKAESTTPYDDVVDKLKEYLKQKRIQEEVLLYIDKLKSKANVTRLLTLEP